MKKLLLIAGTASLIACALSLMLSALSWHGYYHLFDGSADLYIRLHRRMITCFVMAIVLAVIGAASFVLRAKM